MSQSVDEGSFLANYLVVDFATFSKNQKKRPCPHYDKKIEFDVCKKDKIL